MRPFGSVGVVVRPSTGRPYPESSQSVDMKTSHRSFLKTSALLAGGLLASIALHAASVSDYDIVWDSPSEGGHGSMPIGNGDIGANVWVEQNGDLCFYLSKTDAVDEHARFVKLGKLRVRLSPNPFVKTDGFRQRLDLKNGVICLSAAAADLRFWIDANAPVIRITGNTAAKTEVEVSFEPWRTKRVEAKWDRSFTGLADRSKNRGEIAHQRFIEADTIVDGRSGSILWYHRNGSNQPSVWADTLKSQGLADFMKQATDPLQHLTFGALVRGNGLVAASPTLLKSVSPTATMDISVYAMTQQTATAEEWVAQVEAVATEDSKQSRDAMWAAHQAWWNDFWDRSWIQIKGIPGDDTFVVSQGYALQAWITACGSRGSLPVKFNGSIFTVDGYEGNTKLGPDYRSWGSAYWFQNTRLPYWPLMTAGQPELMKPLFKMYMEALPLAKFRGQKYYGFEGAWFPETMYFWGAYTNQDYGWQRKAGTSPEKIATPFVQYLWSGGIELTAMMLDYYSHTQDSDFLTTTLLPFAREIITFYDKRYPRDRHGKLVIEPANAQEDVWACRNPMPEVAGLRTVLPQLIALSREPADKQLYQRLLKATPDFPRGRSKDGDDLLLPAEQGSEKRRGNCEKPECYALFPFRHYGVGLPDLALARETFRKSPTAMRGVARINGWVQDPIFAACVGDVEGAAERIVARSQTFDKGSRFPAFWGPNFDWIPDQCHGGVNMIALQKMLLQTDPFSATIHLFPAWPKEWDCSFKLHAPQRTVIQGVLKDGKLIDLKVTPESRRKDIVNHLIRKTR